jgi:predicted outer membrane repeat protein
MSALNTPIKPLVLAMALASQQVYASCQSSYAVSNGTNAFDDITSLQGAIEHINKNCSDIDIEITVAAGLKISHGEYSHSVHDQERISIIGDAENPATITRGASDALFNVNEGGQLKLKNLILDGQDINAVAGIYLSSSSSRLDLEKVVVKNFYSNASGAVINSITAPITITDSQFVNNHSDANGGAISTIGGDLEIIDTVFTSNSSLSSGGAVFFGGETGEDNLTVQGSQFIKNEAINSGGAVSQSTANAVVIKDTVFDENSVIVNVNDESNTGENIPSDGGAASFYQFDSLELDDVTFTNNSSENFGGAIAIDNNIAGGEDGEAVVNINDSNFTNNSAIKNIAKATVAHGGAIYTKLSSDNDSAKIIVSNTTFDKNSAEGNGGVLYVDDLNGGIEVTMQDSSLTNNSAVGGAGVYIAGSNTVNLDRSLINTNIATGHGSAVYAAGNYNSGDIQAPITRITNSTITNNQAQYGTLALSGYYGEGSNISHSTIHNNTTTQGAAALYGNGVSGSDAIVISHSIISNNAGPSGQLCNLNEANFNFSVEHSFISDADLGSGCLVLTDLGGNQMGTTAEPLDPMLEDLADNGGASLSYYPQDGSPVYNAGNPNIENSPQYDQRGSARIIRGQIDIGALEVGNALPVFADLTDVTIDVKQELNWQVSLATDADGDAISYQVEGLPEGLVFNDSLNTVSGIITEAAFEQSQSYIIGVIASDGFAETRIERQLSFTGSLTEGATKDSGSGSGSGSLGFGFMSLLALIGIGRRKNLKQG